MRSLLASVLALLGVSLCAADDHAVVLLYHHVSKSTPATTSVAPAILRQGTWIFCSGHKFTVWPLGRLIRLPSNGAENIPPDTVAITFDDAYQLGIQRSDAAPAQAEGYPFTLFVSSRRDRSRLSVTT